MSNRTLSDSILTHKRANVRGDLLGQSVRATGVQGGPDLTLPIDTMAYSYYQGTNNLYIDERHLADGTRIIRNHFYDSLDRLIETRELGDPLFSIPPRQVTYTYSADGNITKKSDIGNYTYGGSKPHAVTGVQNSMGLISSSPQSVTYNLYGKVDHVEGDGYSLNIEYGTDRQRWRSTLSDSLSNQVRRVRYFPGMDIVTEGGSTRLFLYADGGTVYVREVSAAESASSVYHRITDRLGNTVSIVRGDGSEVLKARYDEWGKMTCDRNDIGFIRGFTGHETLPELGLINMNGRMFDPFTARFLSPDDYVQAPLSPQGFNRYSYCMNNPLRYTDPSGELAWFVPVIAGAVIGAYTGASIQSHNLAFWNWRSNAWKGAITGAIIGGTLGYSFAASLNASGLIAKGTICKTPGIISSALNSGTINIGYNYISTGDMSDSWKAGLTGVVSGLWATTGGFGMIRNNISNNSWALPRKLAYQMTGTVLNSIGNNWTNNVNVLENLTLGLGPINLTINSKTPISLSNNAFNVLFNSLGMINVACGGHVMFDKNELTFFYSGGLIDKMFPPVNGRITGFSPHIISGNSNLTIGSSTYLHEMHHLWQSRAYNNLYLINYALQGVNALLLHGQFVSRYNYYEDFIKKNNWW